MLDAIAAILFVEIQDSLGVAAVFKLVAFCSKFVAIVGMIVNLAVVNDRTRTVAIKHRLGSVSNIDNAQSAMCQTDISIDKHTASVRSAMMQNVPHLHEFRFIYLPAGAWGKCYAADTAHVMSEPPAVAVVVSKESENKPEFADFSVFIKSGLKPSLIVYSDVGLYGECNGGKCG